MEIILIFAAIIGAFVFMDAILWILKFFLGVGVIFACIFMVLFSIVEITRALT